jgi:hypothetical protein
MILNITLKKEDNLFEAYLNYINPIFKNNKLTDLEIRLLAKLLAIKDRYKQLDKEKLDKILFDKKTKRVIRETLKISEAVFNNTMKTLRAKNFLKYDKLILPEVLHPIVEDNRINISFTLIRDGQD